MSKNEAAGAGSVLMAFILGAMGGAAVALLFAPATGRETREFLGERAREGRDKAAAAAEKGRETVATAIERGRDAYQQARTRETA